MPAACCLCRGKHAREVESEGVLTLPLCRRSIVLLDLLPTWCSDRMQGSALASAEFQLLVPRIVLKPHCPRSVAFLSLHVVDGRYAVHVPPGEADTCAGSR